MTTTKKSNLIKSITPNVVKITVLLLAVGAAFYVGKLSTEVKYLKEGLQNSNLAAQPQAQPQEPEPYQPIDSNTFEFPSDADHIRGSKDANIVIVEYSDFDCPYCGKFHETAKQIVDESEGEVAWIYRHFPLGQLHPDALVKAMASECAFQQGGDDAFWSFSDEIFSTYTGIVLSDSDYTEISGSLGLNASDLTSCVKNEETLSRVEKDLNEGSAAGVRGTPGNYIVNLETETVIPLRGAEPLQNVQNVIGMIQ